ncbi:MAG: threonine/serine exporter family protein [Bacillota bacterium]
MKEIILAFIGSICPGILYNVEKRNLVWIGLCGMSGWITYSRFYALTGELAFSTFLGAVAVGIYSESLARLLRAPTTIFSIPGIFPLVPGITAYSVIQYITERRLYEAASKGIEAVSSAGAIAFGILLTSAVFRIFKRLGKRKADPA